MSAVVYLEDPRDYGQSCPYHRDHVAHSGPHAEHEDGRTEPRDDLEDGDDPKESNISMDVADRAEAAHTDTLKTEEERQEVLLAAAEATVDVFKPQGRDGGKDPDVPQDPDVLQDPDVPQDTDVLQDPDVPQDTDVLQDPEVPQDPDVPQDPEVPQDTDVPQEEDLHRPPQEPELETEMVEDLECPADTPTAGSVHVRRRTRRRKGKKDLH